MPDLAGIRARLEDGESVIEAYLSQSIQVSGYNSHSLSCQIRRDKRGEIKFRIGDGPWRESFIDAIDGWLLKMERAAGKYSLLATLDAQAQKGDRETCSDCPPAGYPTDKTRCDECPRRAQKEAGAHE